MAAVSIDLDGIDLYRAIHGLPSLRAEGARLVYEVALGRASSFAASLGVPLTLFAVGRDLEDPHAVDALRRAHQAGHRVESHSLSHRYDLTRCDHGTMRTEVRRAADAIEAATGRRPTGFRAPGYLVHDRLLSVLRDEGVAWDSSVFPCPAYYLAKLGALGRMAILGRRSAAIVGDPRMMVAPRSPYRPGRRWYLAGGGDLIELPVAVTRRTRLPLIGTSLARVGPRGAALLAAGCVGEPLVVLGLHAVDFLDASDGLEDLSRAQRDLLVSTDRKAASIAAAIEALATAGHRFVTIDEAARSLARGAGV